MRRKERKKINVKKEIYTTNRKCNTSPILIPIALLWPCAWLAFFSSGLVLAFGFLYTFMYEADTNISVTEVAA